MNRLNAREELLVAANWYAHQEEDLSFGLKNAEDALKLWRAWNADPKLPEFCDQPETTAEERKFARIIKEAIGYDPWKEALKIVEAE